MRELTLTLENCYGIKKLNCTVDFSESHTKSLYASNGIMKTSFAKTFLDLSNGIESKDLMFPQRTTIRRIVDENETDIVADQVFVIEPYSDQFNVNKISTLLVNINLKRQYDEIHLELEEKKEKLLRALKTQSGFKGNIENEILKVCSLDNNNFFSCLEYLSTAIPDLGELDYASIDYSEIFNDKVLSFLEKESIRTMMGEYIEKYNELVESSLYFKKGVFNHNNAESVSKTLNKDGFFAAEHRVLLKKAEVNNQDTHKPISNKEEFEQVIKEEKEKILNHPELSSRFESIDTQITKNADLKAFRSYLETNQYIIPELVDLEKFRIKLWCSYLKNENELFNDLMIKYKSGKEEIERITERARSEATNWERVIKIFNNRFLVPFKLSIRNQEDVILKDTVPTVAFMFEDGSDQNETSFDNLKRVLSNGEKKALYILNIIFEIEERKGNSKDNLFIFDDIADSFDYKNKYAIIEYLMDISQEDNFYSIIMTHNFDFFRTITSRIPLRRNDCYMTVKTNNKIELVEAQYYNNPFNYFKRNFTSNETFLIASVPFVRNLIEYSKDNNDSDYLLLTSLLHIKANSNLITIDNLVDVYKRVFPNKSFHFNDNNVQVLNKIFDLADSFLPAAVEVNLEKKIILSIAIRLKAEKFMIDKINDNVKTDAIQKSQTRALFEMFKTELGDNHACIGLLSQVNLMTPENIHLNSFMYEPILDISDDHLRKLYSDVKTHLV